MMSHPLPLQIVQTQLDAYNAKDIDAILQTFAPQAEQFTLHGGTLAKGREQMRERYLQRFAEPDLHAKLLTRIVMGNVVTDFESVTRNFPEGLGTVEMLCVYEIAEGQIQKATYAVGEKRMSSF